MKNIFLFWVIVLYPFALFAEEGDSYFCRDIKSTIFQSNEFYNGDLNEFFVTWEKKQIKTKYVGYEKIYVSELILNKKSQFIAANLDDFDKSGYTQKSLDERDSSNIFMVRTHHDSDFVSFFVSRCLKVSTQ